MKVIHAIWVPDPKATFIQNGQLCIWVESDEDKTKTSKNQHSGQLGDQVCTDFLNSAFNPLVQFDNSDRQVFSLFLPTEHNSPLPDPELALNQTTEPVSLQSWNVHAYPLETPLKALSDIYFITQYQLEEVRISADLLFWYQFSLSIKQIFNKDQYLPNVSAEKLKNKTRLYRQWKIISPAYEATIKQTAKAMPLACSQTYQAESLLRHFAEVNTHQVIETSIQHLPKVLTKKIQGDFSEDIFLIAQSDLPMATQTQLSEPFQQWYRWQQKFLNSPTQDNLQLGFQLYEADPEQSNAWQLNFIIVSHQDPSFKLDLTELWNDEARYQKLLSKQFGDNIQQQILVNLAQAAKIYPDLWQGMETTHPDFITLSLEQTSTFLHESAWVLEDAGYRVLIPAQLTPKGRLRAKMRMRGSSQKQSSSSSSGNSYLNMESLTDYRYELAMGDESISAEEWQQLVELKTPLVHFRGQWMELDQDKMREMLAFWEQQKNNPSLLSAQDLLKKLAEEGDDLELDHSANIAQLLSRLNDTSQLSLINDPTNLNAQLRDYQKRGVSWLRYLESLGLNGCLADDMGLGKTMQVIANLVLEKDQGETGPTLLIAPTSVLGNWQKEIETFAPQLSTLIHHGATREKDLSNLNNLCQNLDMFITSYTLARKDSTLLSKIDWHRIVLDEAQNIKNPKTAQTKAILKLSAKHRLALTGTPVENRLMDLWSIFNFLNPNYLGKQTEFRKTYELPIQRNNDPRQSAILKQLIQPLLLRRLKTDKNIIKDLPDKIENKQYCNLSKEQASLYQAVVKDVEQQLEEKDGIERQGLMLSTLMKLKQICNHPMQFLQDGSPFSPERSHKLERLSDMLSEALAEGDSVLIFTQFTEIGEQLTRYLGQHKHYPTHYLHGGVSRKKREQMIADFQNPDSPASVFVLSLKAGGVGITLTRANHVFHFDRWWNPAVENQATDRAFRIGQKKNVFVHKFVTLGTLEERIDQMIEDKQAMADNIIGNDESWLTKLDNQAFKALIALNTNSIMEA